jgi:hypothetical protein
MSIDAPWTFERAKFPTDGEFDYAIAATIDGKKCVIAEVFGRVAVNTRPDAQATASRIVGVVNLHDTLVSALEWVKVDLEAARVYAEHHEKQPALGIRQSLQKVDAALAAAKAVSS